MRLFLPKIYHYLPVILLVLPVVGLFFVLGWVGLYQLHHRGVANGLYEQIPFTVELKTDTKESEGLDLQRFIQSHKFVKPNSVVFIHKNEGLKQLSAHIQLDSNDSSFLQQSNPLPDVIQFSLKAEYFPQFGSLRELIKQKNIVADVWQPEVSGQQQAEIDRAAGWFMPSRLGWWLLFALVFGSATAVFCLGALHFLQQKAAYVQTLRIYSNPETYVMGLLWRKMVKIGLVAAACLLCSLLISTLLQKQPLYQINQPFGYAALYLCSLLACPLAAYAGLKLAVHYQFQNNPNNQ